MRSVILHEDGDLRTWLLVMDAGDEAMSEITSFARAQQINAAGLPAIGACTATTLSYFDAKVGVYRSRSFTEQMELASFIGDIADDDGDPVMHAHVVLGRSDFSAIAGHLDAITVGPTMEIVLTEHPAHLRKRVDRRSGLTLISAEASTDAE